MRACLAASAPRRLHLVTAPRARTRHRAGGNVAQRDSQGDADRLRERGVVRRGCVCPVQECLWRHRRGAHARSPRSLLVAGRKNMRFSEKHAHAHTARPARRFAGHAGGSLGGRVCIEIAHFNTNEDGTTGQAEAAGCLHVGDVLVAVEGASLRGVPFQQILATIRAAPRYSPARPARRVARLIYLSAPSSCHCSTWHAIFCWVSELCLAQAIVPDLRDPEGQSGCGRGCQSGCGRPPQFHEEIDHGRGCRHRRLVRRSLQPPE